jgi:hypothetical protein
MIINNYSILKLCCFLLLLSLLLFINIITLVLYSTIVLVLPPLSFILWNCSHLCFFFKIKISRHMLVGFFFKTSEQYESQLGWLFPIYAKKHKQHVPNHQPESEDGTGSQYKKKQHWNRNIIENIRIWQVLFPELRLIRHAILIIGFAPPKRSEWQGSDCLGWSPNRLGTQVPSTRGLKSKNHRVSWFWPLSRDMLYIFWCSLHMCWLSIYGCLHLSHDSW